MKKWGTIAFLIFATVTGATLTYLAFGPIMSGIAVVVMGTLSLFLVRDEPEGP